MVGEMLENLPNIASHDGILLFVKTGDRHRKHYFQMLQSQILMLGSAKRRVSVQTLCM